jgi:hypothetical protein
MHSLLPSLQGLCRTQHKTQHKNPKANQQQTIRQKRRAVVPAVIDSRPATGYAMKDCFNGSQQQITDRITSIRPLLL